MAEDKQRRYPYQSLGKRLKGTREKFSETLAEVSGAVEIEVDALKNIELGKQKPSEDILLLLISHFNLEEDEAAKLWDLAQYDKTNPIKDPDMMGYKSAAVVLPSDIRIAYTDLTHVIANKHGVVVNFVQESGPTGQPLIVSRVGMSREHAKNLIDTLQQTLYKTEQKALPSPKQTRKSREKTDRKDR